VFPGSNCDRDLYYALERAGLRPRYLWHADTALPPLEAVFLPGGFSYGDYLRPGAIARFSRIMPAIEDFWRGGGFVMGICNGFQILVEAGWLPGALLRNGSGRFICAVTTIVPQLTPGHPLGSYLGGAAVSAAHCAWGWAVCGSWGRGAAPPLSVRADSA
jgi:phosphoribosylformylglycinamidine (FGAM) synthase-like amidotransferase family enzyme